MHSEAVFGRRRAFPPPATLLRRPPSRGGRAMGRRRSRLGFFDLTCNEWVRAYTFAHAQALAARNGATALPGASFGETSLVAVSSGTCSASGVPRTVNGTGHSTFARTVPLTFGMNQPPNLSRAGSMGNYGECGNQRHHEVVAGAGQKVHLQKAPAATGYFSPPQ